MAARRTLELKTKRRGTAGLAEAARPRHALRLVEDV
jgi:hypothetical protein